MLIDRRPEKLCPNIWFNVTGSRRRNERGEKATCMYTILIMKTFTQNLFYTTYQHGLMRNNNMYRLRSSICWFFALIWINAIQICLFMEFSIVYSSTISIRIDSYEIFGPDKIFGFHFGIVKHMQSIKISIRFRLSKL